MQRVTLPTLGASAVVDLTKGETLDARVPRGVTLILESTKGFQYSFDGEPADESPVFTESETVRMYDGGALNRVFLKLQKKGSISISVARQR